MRLNENGQLELTVRAVDTRRYCSDPRHVADCTLLIDVAALAAEMTPKANANKSRKSRALKGAVLARVHNVRGAQ